MSKDPTEARNSHGHLHYQSSRRQSLSTSGNHSSTHLQIPPSSASSSSLQLSNKNFKLNNLASPASDVNHTPLTTQIKDSTCPVCASHFKRRYDLVQHISAVHEKRRPFPCTACDQAFAHKGTLSKHFRTVHKRERPYVCEHCGQRFSERGNVNKHKQRSARCRDAEAKAQNNLHPTSASSSIRKH